jgi:hypothetical protein
MADHDIQKSKHLLKRLNENIDFLSSLLDQAQFMVLELKVTQVEIDNVIKDCFRKNIDNS